MPAKTTIFNSRGKVKYNFDLGMRNTIAYSPHGRYLLVAGFGNLNGQMDIYDLSANYTKVATIEAPNSSVCEWSPDGRHILTATTSPRLRVDNGIRIWHVSGKLMYNQDFPELYEVYWRPQSVAQHPLGQPMKEIPAPHPSATAYMATRKTPSKPVGAYRPPGARGASTPLSFKREDEGGASFSSQGLGTAGLSSANGAFGPNRRRVVPGAESSDPPGAEGGVSLAGYEHITGGQSKSAAKNKKKREAKKAREAEAKAKTLAPDGTNGDGRRGGSRSPNRNGGRSRSKSDTSRVPRDRGMSRGRGPPPEEQQQQSNQQPQGRKPQPGGGKGGKPKPSETPQQPPPLNTNSLPAPSLNVVGATPITAIDEKSPFEKKLRGLHKKIRAIDDLKMKQAAGVKLEMTQLAKIESEDQVRAELKALGGGDG
jgi:translation initiation factor 2A